MPDAAAYDLSAGCTGFMYAIAQAYGMLAAGLVERALVVGGDVLSRVLDWTDRSTLVLFGDGAGAVVLEPVDDGGFLGFELGADGAGGPELLLPCERLAPLQRRRPLPADERPRGVQVRDAGNGQLRGGDSRRVRKDGRRRGRVRSSPGQRPDHRSRDEEARHPEEKVVVNVDRYGNTSSGSIPLALADAADDGRLNLGNWC